MVTRFLTVVAVLLAVSSTATYAQMQLGFNGVGGRLFFVKPSDVDGTIGLSGIADLGTLAPNMRLQGAIDFWSKSAKENGIGASFRDIALCAAVQYMLGQATGVMQPYLTGGLGIHFLTADVDLGYLGSASDTSTKIGIDAGGGVMYQAAPNIDVVAEAKYRIVSDINQFAVFVGALFHLTK